MLNKKAAHKKPLKGRTVFLYFLLFFGVIFAVNGVYVYTALTTQPGVITEKAYEKGLAYNEVLARADAQPALTEQAQYDAPFLIWRIQDEAGKPIENAHVTAHIIRPVQEGMDFDITLQHQGSGDYRATLTLPEKGAWVAKLDSQWDEQTKKQRYKTTLPFTAQ